MRDLAVAEPFGPELEPAPLPLRQRPHDRTKPSYPLQPGEPFLRGDLAWRAAASDGRDRPTTPAIARSRPSVRLHEFVRALPAKTISAFPSPSTSTIIGYSMMVCECWGISASTVPSLP